jgi:ADP-heptose:LPS heptosyltransferase
LKILVLSLLRLGDLLQQRPLLAALKKAHPDAELHLLVNQSVRTAEAIVTEADVWHSFDREHLQQQIGTAEIPLMAPLRDVEDLTDGLNDQKFDLLLNFTHNRLSAYLAQMITAKAKKGLVADGTRFLPFENQWLRHFNERFSSRDGSPFHYVELLAHSFHLTSLAPPAKTHDGKRVLIQPLTSDVKKNWGLTAWSAVMHGLRHARPDLDIRVLGAPFEKEALLKFFDADDLEIADLAKVSELLKTTSLVLSGDTSIKHLAAATGTPVLELALGSAAPEKTGAYMSNAVILHAAIDCAPCTHSSPCRRLSHLCGESLPARLVLLSVLKMLDHKTDDIADLFTESPKIKVYRSHLLASSGWILQDQKLSPEEFIADLFEKNVWGLALQGETPLPVGTQSHLLFRDLKSLGLESALPAALALLSSEQRELETLLAHRTKSIALTSQNCMTDGFNPQQLQAERRELASLIPASRRLRLHLRELGETGLMSYSSPLAFFGAVRRTLDEVRTRTYIRAKMIDQLREAGGLDGKPSRNVFEHGSATP